MRPYDDYDAARDMDTVDNGGCSGTSYTGADPGDDVNDARDRLEKEGGYYQTLRGNWERDE